MDVVAEREERGIRTDADVFRHPVSDLRSDPECAGSDAQAYAVVALCKGGSRAQEGGCHEGCSEIDSHLIFPFPFRRDLPGVASRSSIQTLL